MRKRRSSYMSSGTMLAATEHKLNQELHPNLREKLQVVQWSLEAFQLEADILRKEGHSIDANI